MIIGVFTRGFTRGSVRILSSLGSSLGLCLAWKIESSELCVSGFGIRVQGFG